MSRIAVSTIFLKKAYGTDEAILIDEILNQLADQIKSTRKGRFWEIVKDNYLYNIDVRKTE